MMNKYVGISLKYCHVLFFGGLAIWTGFFLDILRSMNFLVFSQPIKNQDIHPLKNN